MNTTATRPKLRGGHVGLNVADLDRSKPFYTKVFGLEVMHESTEPDRRYAFLGADGQVLVTLWQQSEGQFDTGRPGLHHASFQVPDVEAVRQAEATLRELGAALHHDGVVRHGEGSDSAGVFFSDPDGIRLEIYAATGAGSAPAPTESAPACGFF